MSQRPLGASFGLTTRMLAASARDVLGPRTPQAAVGLSLVAAWLVAAAVSPLLGYPVGADVDPAARSLAPCAAHWLGTDHLGRDVFHRALLASRAFALPGLTSCGLAASLGIPAGALAGYGEGLLAAAVRAGLAALASVPALVLVLLAGAVLGPSQVVLAVAAGVASVPTVAEAVRARVEALRVEEFVLGSRAHGLSDARILLLHLVAVASGPLVARRLIELFGGFVALEATLAYLGGFGVREPVPSWGNMVSFEWGWPLGASSIVPALAVWATVSACSSAATAFAEADDG